MRRRQKPDARFTGRDIVIAALVLIVIVLGIRVALAARGQATEVDRIELYSSGVLFTSFEPARIVSEGEDIRVYFTENEKAGQTLWEEDYIAYRGKRVTAVVKAGRTQNREQIGRIIYESIQRSR